MAITIDTNLSATVGGGPSLARNIHLEVEAYDLVDVEIPDLASDLDIELQPGAAGQVQFLLVLATSYNPPLTYKINAGGNPAHKLDRELLLAGEGAIGLLGFPPNSLLFSNNTGSAIDVQILVGRKV